MRIARPYALFVLSASLTLLGIGTQSAVAGKGDCGQPKSTGSNPTTSDCLYILKFAVGGPACTPACICDTNGNGTTQTSDALLCLRVSVGNTSVELACDCPATTTTTSTTTTLPPQCADISGSWIGGGNGKYACKIDGENISDSGSGFGVGEVDQNKCTASFSVIDEVFDIELFFQGPVTFSSFNFTGDWLPDDLGLSCSQNYVSGHGLINQSATRIDFTYTAVAKCSGSGHSVSCTGSGTERWTR